MIIEKGKNFAGSTRKVTESLENYSYQKKTLTKVFYYEPYNVLIVIDVCVEQLWKSAHIRKIKQPAHA